MHSRVSLYRTLTLALFAAFMLLLLYRVWTTPVWTDSAVFASVAKNILHGHGYSAVEYDHFIPFHVGITSGPLIILPTTLMVYWFGNLYWVPGLTQVILIAVLLVAALWQMHLLCRKALWPTALIFLLSTIIFTLHDLGLPHEPMLAWHALLGDIPSALLVIIACLYIAPDRTNATRLWWGGIVLGCACLCKLQAFIGCTVVGCFLMLPILVDSSWPFLQRVKYCVIFTMGLVLPLLAFEIVQLYVMGLDGYIISKQRLLHFIYVLQIDSKHASWQEKLSILFLKLWDVEKFFGPVPFRPNAHDHTTLLISVGAVLFCGMLFTLVAMIRRAWTQRHMITTFSPEIWSGNILLYMGTIHLLWFIFVCQIEFSRYAVQGIFYLCAGSAILLAQYEIQSNYRIPFIAIVLVAIVLWRYEALSYVFTTPAPHPLIAESEAVEKRLEEFKDQHADGIIFSCDIVFEMEYLLPHDGNIIPCAHIHDSEFIQRPHVLLRFMPETSQESANAPSQYHMEWFPPGQMRPEIREALPDDIRTACPKDDIFAGTQYFIASCPM